jgi:hypothetical protein
VISDSEQFLPFAVFFTKTDCARNLIKKSKFLQVQMVTDDVDKRVVKLMDQMKDDWVNNPTDKNFFLSK